ncbi:MAG: MBL fold metallo-hydrolase [bacterium]
MKISFHGAAQEVTGSCALVETDKTKFIVDCGIFQGEKFAAEHNLKPFDFEPSEIDFAILTHAHLDHCGRLPKLFRDGFSKVIYATAPTIDFADIMLLDSARIIYEEAMRYGHEALYSENDVIGLMKLFEPLPYGEFKQITPEIKIRLRDAGHILGSASVEIWINENGQETKLVFSGDLGNPPAPIVADTEYIEGADIVVVESTYGDRVHESKEERKQKLLDAIKHSVAEKGVLMIPAFALERTQEILYELYTFVSSRKISNVPIFVDSPLAIKATQVYKKYVDMYDAESRAIIERGDDLFNFPGLTYTMTVAQSKEINRVPPPKVILAGNGMCTGGRIPHHLKLYLGSAQNDLLFLSYQAEGSLGRRLLEKQKKVTIDGEEIYVQAGVSAIGAYSSHADQPALTKWVHKIISPKPKKIFVVHGESVANKGLAEALKKKFKGEIIIAEYKKIY